MTSVPAAPVATTASVPSMPALAWRVSIEKKPRTELMNRMRPELSSTSAPPSARSGIRTSLLRARPIVVSSALKRSSTRPSSPARTVSPGQTRSPSAACRAAPSRGTIATSPPMATISAPCPVAQLASAEAAPGVPAPSAMAMATRRDTWFHFIRPSPRNR